ncbi:hypothetical protein MLD59_02880 [Verrucomicrobiaceae bacterium E54]|nr:hypothetical protein [Verrucomicrobiaceae bacterium E54]
MSAPLMMTMKVAYPAGATLSTNGITVEDDTGFKWVNLNVGVKNGPLPLADLRVLWSPDLTGPWNELGTIPGDGTTFSGNVELPDDPVGGPVKRAFFIAEAR